MLIHVRTMQLCDLDEVMRIQALCYFGDIPESRSSLQAKLLASPRSCFVAVHDETILAYLFSLPWVRSAPPQLNSPDCVLPSEPNCYYLHDLSVTPSARQHGAGRALVSTFFNTMQDQGFDCACLVAVQDSANYWRRYGFDSVELTGQLQDKLATYGSTAEYMQRSSYP
jgi:ribosomal protein S18 acetylase RimI-like enzyme